MENTTIRKETTLPSAVKHYHPKGNTLPSSMQYTVIRSETALSQMLQDSNKFPLELHP